MKTLITILLLTSTLTAFGQDVQPEYYDHKTDQELKEKEKGANAKILGGIALIGLGAITITADDDIENKKVLYTSGGAAIGAGLVVGASGVVQKIEVRKVKRKRNNKKD